MKKENKVESKKKSNYKWIAQLAIMAFSISFVFSFISEIALQKANLLISVIVVLLFIFLGIIFDMVGVAVTAADEAPFHSMSSRNKEKAAKVAVILKKNADKTSSFCCDVIGDICGIISGSAGVVIATNMSEIFNMEFLYATLITTAIIAALTIGGKGYEKTIAMDKGNSILYTFAKVISIFYKEGKKK